MKPTADPTALALHRRQTELVRHSLLCVGRLPGERSQVSERDPRRAAKTSPHEPVWHRAA